MNYCGKTNVIWYTYIKCIFVAEQHINALVLHLNEKIVKNVRCGNKIVGVFTLIELERRHRVNNMDYHNYRFKLWKFVYLINVHFPLLELELTTAPCSTPQGFFDYYSNTLPKLTFAGWKSLIIIHLHFISIYDPFFRNKCAAATTDLTDGKRVKNQNQILYIFNKIHCRS